MAVNFVIVEVETKQVTYKITHTLAYMGREWSLSSFLFGFITDGLFISSGMIRAQRRYEGRANCTVFGLSTDNEQFHFLRINNKGEVSRPILLLIREIQGGCY